MNERTGLFRAFSPRMRLLSFLTGVFISFSMPTEYWIMSWAEQKHDADSLSREIAQKVKETVRVNPELWKFSVVKFMKIFDDSEGRGIAQARIYDADGKLLERQDFRARSIVRRTGSADIVYNNIRFGHVEVDKIADPVLWATFKLLFVFSVLGLGVAYALYFFPAGIVRKAEADVDGMLNRLNVEIAEGLLKERRIGESLREKEILLKEIHHRVKNNLQIIISMISLRLAASEDTEAGRILQDIERKVRAMALVHKQLYESPSLSLIRMNAYLFSLVAAYRDTYTADDPCVDNAVDAGDIELSVEIAMPIGLIVGELITNSRKHAFSGMKRGKIGISLERRAGRKLRLTVVDDGKGAAAELREPSGGKLGFMLVRGPWRSRYGERFPSGRAKGSRS